MRQSLFNPHSSRAFQSWSCVQGCGSILPARSRSLPGRAGSSYSAQGLDGVLQLLVWWLAVALIHFGTVARPFHGRHPVDASGVTP